MIQLDNFVMMRWEAEATVVPAESRFHNSFHPPHMCLVCASSVPHLCLICANHQDISIAATLASLLLVKLRLSNLYKKLSSTKKISLVILLTCHECPQIFITT